MLPKIQQPIFTLTIPSTKEEIQYRPFLVKEEKILLIAQESSDEKDKITAVKQIVNNCILTEGIDIEKLATFDVEYMFIQMRAKSVNNIATIVVHNTDDDKDYEVDVNLDDIEVNFNDDYKNTIQLNENLGVKLRYPSYTISENVYDFKDPVDMTMYIIKQSIESVFDEENVYPWSDSSNEEKDEFLNSLDVNSFDKLNDFFTTLPSLEHKVEYTADNGEARTVTVRGIRDLFFWG